MWLGSGLLNVCYKYDDIRTMHDLTQLIHRAETVLERLEQYLPAPSQPPDWSQYWAGHWQAHGAFGSVRAIPRIHQVRLQDLQCIDRQKTMVARNTRQFLQGYPANNVLLWGPKGTGKSSLIKAVLNEYAEHGLRLVEVDRSELSALPDIMAPLAESPYRFMIYCDDLSFEADDPSYKALKATLDGSISATPDNVLLYATSNRRHLLPEWASDNQTAHIINKELHHGEAVEEKISLSERFGMWLAFHPFSQDDYLHIVAYWLQQLGWKQATLEPEVRQAALQWALQRGSRSGRAAWQFARDWVGQQALDNPQPSNQRR